MYVILINMIFVVIFFGFSSMFSLFLLIFGLMKLGWPCLPEMREIIQKIRIRQEKISLGWYLFMVLYHILLKKSSSKEKSNINCSRRYFVKNLAFFCLRCCDVCKSLRYHVHTTWTLRIKSKNFFFLLHT